MAKVLFKRYETDAEAQASNVVDGQFIVTKEGTSYTDYGNDRVAFGGTLDTQMSDSSINGVQNKVIKEYVDDGVQEAKDYVDEKQTYSTTETVVGTYNGKPLYRKEVEYAQINLGTNTTSWDQQLSFTNIRNMFLDTTHSFFVDTDTGLHLPIPYVNPSSNTPVSLGYFIEITNGVPTFHLRKSSYIKVWTINLVLEYTKTTD